MMYWGLRHQHMNGGHRIQPITWEKWEMTTDEFRASFWGDENVLELVVIDAQICEYTRNHCLF